MYSGVPHMVHVLLACKGEDEHPRRGEENGHEWRGRDALVGDHLGESKVGQLDVAVAVEQKVFGLEISVRYVQAVQVSDGKHDLGRIEAGSVVWQAPAPANARE